MTTSVLAVDDGNPVFWALLDVRLPDDRELARIGRLWVEAACRGLAPGWWERLQASLPLGPHGEPGGVYAYVSVTPRPWQERVDAEVFSPESFGWLLGELAARPLSAEVQLRELNDRGEFFEGGGGGLRVLVRTEEDHPDWVQLQASGRVPGAEGDARRPEVPARWARALRTVAAQADASFGHLCDDGNDGGTALDRSVFRGGRVSSMMAGRDVLRGYSWVTVCPDELAARLGGPPALAASGAFSRVEELPLGGVWLQATEDFAGYDDAAMRRVFEVLAPVLPEGLAEPEPMEQQRYRLVWEDAAWYRPGGRAALAAQPQLGREVAHNLAALGPDSGAAANVPGGYELLFRRHLSHDCATVWRALTDPAAVSSWLGWRPPGIGGPRARIDPVPGGQLILPYCYPTERGPRIVRNTTLGTVTAITQPELLEYATPGMDGPDAAARWQLRPEPGGGCALSFRYTVQIHNRLAWLLADWHCRLDALTMLLGGTGPTAAWDNWPARHGTYRAAIHGKT